MCFLEFLAQSIDMTQIGAYMFFEEWITCSDQEVAMILNYTS